MIKRIPFLFFLPLICCCLLCCKKQKTEVPVSEIDTISSITNTVVKETFSDTISKYIRIIPTMNSSFSDSNTVHCSNVEYLLNALAAKSDKNISDNRLIKEFARSSQWKNSMDTSSLVLALGKPHEVYESIIDQYRTKYGMEKTDLSPRGSTFWGYTDKVVNYKYDEPFDKQPLLFLGTEVEAFGFNSEFSSSYANVYFMYQFVIIYFYRVC